MAPSTSAGPATTPHVGGHHGQGLPGQPHRVVVLSALGAAAVLMLAAPGPVALATAVAAPARAADPTGPLVALLALLAWVCAAHLLLVTALTLGARLPGAVGAALDATAWLVAPAALRRALALAIGAGVALGAGTGPATAAPQRAPAVSVAPSPASPVPPLDHPVAATAPFGADALTSGTARGTRTGAHTDRSTRAPADVSTRGAPARPRRAVVVQPGDCLWVLAERHLGTGATPAQVAQEWPAWWAANRAVIGDDPDLIHPGTRLVPPSTR